MKNVFRNLVNVDIGMKDQQERYIHVCMNLPVILPGIGDTLTPVGVTMVGVTTLMPDIAVELLIGVLMGVPGIFCVAAAAAARAAIPVI